MASPSEGALTVYYIVYAMAPGSIVTMVMLCLMKVAYARKDLKADIVFDMATLTSAQVSLMVLNGSSSLCILISFLFSKCPKLSKPVSHLAFTHQLQGT